MRVVLDTNVLISALAFPGSKPDQILDRVRRHELQLIISPFILEELRRILVRKFGLAPETATALTRIVASLGEMVHPAKRLHVVSAKEDDNRVLECAVAGEAEVLVTGDRTHLLPLQAVGKARIVSPGDFLAMLGPPP